MQIIFHLQRKCLAALAVGFGHGYRGYSTNFGKSRAPEGSGGAGSREARGQVLHGRRGVGRRGVRSFIVARRSRDGTGDWHRDAGVRSFIVAMRSRDRRSATDRRLAGSGSSFARGAGVTGRCGQALQCCMPPPPGPPTADRDATSHRCVDMRHGDAGVRSFIVAMRSRDRRSATDRGLAGSGSSFARRRRGQVLQQQARQARGHV
jgi:hypothetical protein